MPWQAEPPLSRPACCGPTNASKRSPARHFPPIAVEAVKQEYDEALNHYVRSKDLGILIDLMLQLID